MLEAAHAVDEEIRHLVGRVQILPAYDALFEIAARHALNEAQGKDVFSAHPLNLLQLLGRSVQNGRQRAKTGQRSPVSKLLLVTQITIEVLNKEK